MSEQDPDHDPDEANLPDLSSLFGEGGMPDLGSMLEGLGSIQSVQQQAYEGSAGGGLVKIRANGRMNVESVTIDPEAVADGDAELLADLVMAALHDLTAQIAAAQQEAMGPLGGLLGGQ